jgi:nucleotide-binding universal stress UspA family protein
VTSMTEAGAVEPQQSARVERVVLAADDSFGAIAAAGWLVERALHHPMTIEIAVVEGHVRTGRRTGSAHQVGEGVAWGMREYLGARIPAAPTTVRVLPGEPVEALRRAAADGDLFVIGCNRDGFWHRLPIATRSTRIAEVAVRPMVVVPSTWVAAPGVVLAAVSGLAPEVVDWAAEEAASSGRLLEIVHGDLLATGSSSERLPDTGILEEAERRMIAAHVARVRAAHPGLQVRTVLEHEGVAGGLIRRGGDTATIVVGTRTHGRAGSVLRAVLERTACPVVVVPVALDEDEVEG